MATDQGTDPFRPLSGVVAMPNSARGPDGRPTEHYWQQRLTYKIRARLDEGGRSLAAEGTLQYHNHSPATLDRLLFEIAANSTRRDAVAQRSMTIDPDAVPIEALQSVRAREEAGGGVDVLEISAGGNAVHFLVRGTQLSVDLPQPLLPGASIELRLRWTVRLVDVDREGGRAGYIRLEDGEPIFHVAQWYPQPIAYTDYAAWDTTPFVSAGEFSPEFGDYEVSLDVPKGYVVAGSGRLVNPGEVLSARQLERLESARSHQATPIVTVEESARAVAAPGRATWRFAADGVRDFAFAASRRYAWDAKELGKDGPLAMAFYPPHAASLWGRFTLPAIEHTLRVYGRQAFPYPYPVVQAAYGPIDGMEHSMLAFSRYAPDGAGGQYSWRMKRDYLWVLMHEVGHNWFPLTVNSDERQWTWMDEGLNSFLEHQALLAWSRDYIDRPNEPAQQWQFAGDDALQPPMTPANSVGSLFPSQYNRPAAALAVLRETVVGRDVFDRAFRTFADTWKFKRPTPGDFFRLMNQETGMDLDWFWRGWFFTSDHVDLELVGMQRLDLRAGPSPSDEVNPPPRTSVQARTAGAAPRTVVEDHPELADPCDASVTGIPPSRATSADIDAAQSTLRELSRGGAFYLVEVVNHGRLLSPVPLLVRYEDGSAEQLQLPVQVWLSDAHRARHLLWRARPIRSVAIDESLPTGDVNAGNDGSVQRVAPGLATVPAEASAFVGCTSAISR